MAMFTKESCIDTREDIAMVKKYLNDKLGEHRYECTRHQKYSNMTETDLDPEKVGWSVMLQKEQQLRDWLAKIIKSGELGAVGEAPPDLAAELGLDMEALNADAEVDGVGAEVELGGMEVAIDGDGQDSDADDASDLLPDLEEFPSGEDSDDEEFFADTPPHDDVVEEEEEEEEELSEEFISFVSISPIAGDQAPACIPKCT